MVVAVAFAAHGWLHAELFQQTTAFMHAILAAAIGMMNPFGHRIADDFTTAQVTQDSQIRSAFVGCG